MQDEIKDFLRQHAAEGRSPRTITGYRQYLLRMAKHLRKDGVKRAVEVTPRHLDEYLISMLESGLIPAVVEATKSPKPGEKEGGFRPPASQQAVTRNLACSSKLALAIQAIKG